jgi:hypothetical protein
MFMGCLISSAFFWAAAMIRCAKSNVIISISFQV